MGRFDAIEASVTIEPPWPAAIIELGGALAGHEHAAQVDVHHQVETVEVDVDELARAPALLRRSADTRGRHDGVDTVHQFGGAIDCSPRRLGVADVDVDEVRRPPAD